MPFYEYSCAKCGHHHEELQKVSDPPLRKCPECGKSGLTRLISAPVFRLKGGGWYETDFKSEQQARRNLAGEQDAAPKPEEAAKSAEAPKPEAKADTATATKPGATRDKPAKPSPHKPRAAANKASSGRARKR